MLSINGYSAVASYKKILLFMMIILICLSNQILYAENANVTDVENIRTIAVLSFTSKEETLVKWQPLAAYLNMMVEDQTFEIYPIVYTEFSEAVENKSIDYILTNPAHYIALGQEVELSGAIATIINLSEGKPQYGFGGVVFTRNQEGTPKTLEDLKGKIIAAVSKNSLGGYQASAYELKKIGFDLDKDISIELTGMPHKNTVEMVMTGEADAGFVRSGVLEGLIKSGDIQEDDLIVLNEQNLKALDHLLSTDLYPEWPFLVLDHIDKSEAQRVAASLFLMGDHKTYADEIGIYGFTIPSNYLQVELMMRGLKVAPFDIETPVTLAGVWMQYHVEVLLVLVIIILIVVYAINKARVGTILSNKNAELVEISIKDSLTGLYNRRYFENFLDEKLENVQENDTNIAIFVIDIDNFKYYNDTFGHDVGDCVLVEVAKTLQNRVWRSTDIVARYAGDEFIIILYDVKRDAVKTIAEDVLHAIKKLRVKIPHEKKELTVSISMGVTTAQKVCQQTSMNVFKIADNALYRAKEQGKNCYVIKECECLQCDE